MIFLPLVLLLAITLHVLFTILEAIINDESWLVNIEMSSCSFWRICALIVRYQLLLLVKYLLTLALQKAHVLGADILVVEFNVRLAKAAGHFLLATAGLLRPRAPIARLLLLHVQVSIVISHLILKGLLVVNEFLVLIQKPLLQFIISGWVRPWSLRGNLGMLESFLSLAL